MIKKLLIVAFVLGMAGVARAAPQVWQSSNTATAATTLRVLCNQNQKAIFHGVCTSFGVASASMTVVGSTWTYSGATTVVGPISTLVADQCKYYDIVVNRGLSFFKNNAATVTILYQCY